MSFWDRDSKTFDQFMVEEDSRREEARIRRKGDPGWDWIDGVVIAPSTSDSKPVNLNVKAFFSNTWQRVTAGFRHPPRL
jgi:hypothetical protein